jgi:ArsR family transcriptional regulator
MTTIPTELIGETAAEVPCPPLGAAELSAAEAERMACMFKALADPVRAQQR